MNKIYIHRGDCVVFADITDFLTFMIDSDLDLTNWKAEFHLGIIVKKYDDITSKVVKVILSAEETKTLKLGEWNGALVLIDAKGHRKTIINTIPFVITDEVVENSYQTIDLTIPETAGVDIQLKVGTASVTSINGKSGEVTLTAQDVGALPDTTVIPDISNLASKEELAGKQDKGDYALVSDIPTLVSELQNDSNFATQTQVMQAIASIPQFKLSIVSELPSTGEKMTLYLVAKEGSENDVYNEYIWIEQTSSFEFLGTTAVDLTGYVKNTDIATTTKLGLVFANGVAGIRVNVAGNISTVKATDNEITNRSSDYKPIVPTNLNFAVNSVLPTMTQAEYDALETKDENLFYMIVEE